TQPARPRTRARSARPRLHGTTAPKCTQSARSSRHRSSVYYRLNGARAEGERRLLVQTPGRTITSAMKSHRLAGAGIASLMLAAPFAVGAHAQDKAKDKDKENDKRPQLKLTARPPLGMAPLKVVLTGDLLGGPNDSEEFYCPSIEWDWGDGTQ